MNSNTPQVPMDPQSIVSAVKSLRKNITFEGETLRSLPKTRETSLALTKLEEGVMWLGKELQRLGDLFPDLLRDPYPTSKDPTVTTIDPPAPEVCTGACACNTTEPVPTEPAVPVPPVVPVTRRSRPSLSRSPKEMAVVSKCIRGEMGLSIPEKGIRDAVSLALICDAHGLRVMSSEDFATVKLEVIRQRQAAGKLDDQGFFQDVIASMDKVIAILNAWTPPGR